MHVASGRLELRAVELARLDVVSDRFDKVFAINVNVFWTGRAEPELRCIRDALAHGGEVFLVFDLPSATRASEITARVGDSLWTAGFREPDVLRASPKLVCCRTGLDAGF
jgi:hypothetical protein